MIRRIKKLAEKLHILKEPKPPPAVTGCYVGRCPHCGCHVAADITDGKIAVCGACGRNIL